MSWTRTLATPLRLCNNEGMGNPSFDAPRARYSEWFRSVREQKKLKVTEAARELGIDPSAITRWEHGKALPMTPLLRRIALWAPVSSNRLVIMLSEDIPLDP